MGWWSKIFGGGVGDTVEKVTSGLDNLFTSDEERLQWEAKRLGVQAALQKELAQMETTLETKLQEELSARHARDMQSDSWLSKNIRPITFVHIQLLLDVVVVLAYYGYTLESALVALIGGAFNAIIYFYFGGRSLEKGVKMVASALRKPTGG